jgi:hypothetical protein
VDLLDLLHLQGQSLLLGQAPLKLRLSRLLGLLLQCRLLDQSHQFRLGCPEHPECPAGQWLQCRLLGLWLQLRLLNLWDQLHQLGQSALLRLCRLEYLVDLWLLLDLLVLCRLLVLLRRLDLLNQLRLSGLCCL